MKELMQEDARRSFLALPEDALRSQIRQSDPEFDDEKVEKLLEGFQRMRRADPLAVLQNGTFDGSKSGGLMTMSKLSPNFEMAMYLAQAVGGSIVTDSRHRWEEIRRAIRWRPPRPSVTLQPLSRAMASADFAFIESAVDALEIADTGICDGYASILSEACRYALAVEKQGEKANFESGLAARFMRTHTASQTAIAKSHATASRGRVTCAFPWGGIQDNTVNRLLLMSSSERHMPNVPMAFFIEQPAKGG
jgi:hypothetical protein